MSFVGLCDDPQSAVYLAQYGIFHKFKQQARLSRLYRKWSMVEQELILIVRAAGRLIDPIYNRPKNRRYANSDHAELVETYFFMYSHELGKKTKVALKAAKATNVVSSICLKSYIAGITSPGSGSAGVSNFISLMEDTNTAKEIANTLMGGPGLGVDGAEVGGVFEETAAALGNNDTSGSGKAAAVIKASAATALALDNLSQTADGAGDLASGAAGSAIRTELGQMFDGNYNTMAVQQITPMIHDGRVWNAIDNSDVRIGQTSLALADIVAGFEEYDQVTDEFILNPWAAETYIPETRSGYRNRSKRAKTAIEERAGVHFSIQKIRYANQVPLQFKCNALGEYQEAKLTNCAPVWMVRNVDIENERLGPATTTS